MSTSPDPNAWKRGLRVLDVGLYADAEGAMHIDVEEFLPAHGYAVTPANVEMVKRGFADVCRDNSLEPIIVDEVRRR